MNLIYLNKNEKEVSEYLEEVKSLISNKNYKFPKELEDLIEHSQYNLRDQLMSYKEDLLIKFLFKCNYHLVTAVNAIEKQSLLFFDFLKKTIEKVQKSIVGITFKKETTAKLSNGNEFIFEDKEAIGSGVIYKRVENYDNDKLIGYTYYVSTNAHVVTCQAGCNESVKHTPYIYLDEEQLEYKFNVLGYDVKADIACGTFESPLYFPIVEIEDEGDLKKGEFVVVCGHSYGYEYFNSAYFGIVSNTKRYLSFDSDSDGVNDYVGVYYQTDAAINGGTSGGGVFTLDGKFVGIPSIKIASSQIDNMGFFIPSSIVKTAINNYLENGIEIIRPRLGITGIAVRDFNSQTLVKYNFTEFPNIYQGSQAWGIYVTEVMKEGTVSDIMEAGDILLTFDGIKIYKFDDVSGRMNAFSDYQVGSKVVISYYDSSEKIVKEVEVTLKTE